MKKISLVRLLAAVMTLALALGALSGCGKKNGENKPDPYAGMPAEELVVGKWETKVEFSQLLNDTLTGENAGMFQNVSFSGITVTVNAEFKADGTYAMAADKTSVEDAVKQAGDRSVPALKELIRQEIAEGAGIDASQVTDQEVDAMLPIIGIQSWDELGDMLVETMDADNLLRNINRSGRYLYKDGMLYMTASDEEATVDSDAWKCEVSGQSMTLHAEKVAKSTPDFLRQPTFSRGA